MTDLYRNLVAGEWVEGEGETENINPSNTDEVVGRYARASKTDAERAIQAAKAAFPAWSRSGIQQRHDIFAKASAEILARKDELGRLLAREEGKTLVEATGEVAVRVRSLRSLAARRFGWRANWCPAYGPGVEVAVQREAVGVVGLITPWNFPIAIPAWKLAPAIVYGNTVVLKPADLVPGSAWALADILDRAGLPKGCSTSSWARARWSDRPSSIHPTWTPSPSPARSLRASASPRLRSSICAGSSSKWAARTR
jgi:aldehyde dehydrogenase (NAD+)